MIGTIIRSNPLTAAVRASGFLANWFKLPDLATCERVDPAFAELAMVLEALSPVLIDAGTLCYLRNHVASSGRLYRAGEWGAAAHQLRHIHRKLSRLQAEGE